MTTSDPVDILLTQNRWATRNLLEACAALPHEQFHQRFEMGPGSLHDTVTHILGAMRGWGDMLAGREQRPRLEEGGASPPFATPLNEQPALCFSPKTTLCARLTFVTGQAIHAESQNEGLAPSRTCRHPGV